MDSLSKQILAEYTATLDALVERELLIDSNPLLATQYQDRTHLTWSNSTGLSYLFSDHSSIEQYVSTLNNRDFSFCLLDGSLVQIEYWIEDGVISHHRLCFVPCPFPYAQEDWVGFSLAEIPYLMSAEDLLKTARLASPVRFDFDSNVEDARHSRAHLTFNMQTCRVPAYGPVSLGHFIRFILRYFFQSEFESQTWWHEIQPRLYARTLDHPSPHEVHIESAVGFA